ncbi:hypothetical protein HOP50_10g60950 [Chloropicon primus]|uniref:DUF1754-domain-containing protein n=1 Tax=Chloropicon primus TaxID=1764295 RepID=A0A5B8MTC0_9CHLO|nr:hypothetical protein A3770_10p60740 [Chloropicon primus]UPR02768.1 hypothetical protein HOP50_10g60950 [Chloropicon primus]|eukprot:QDZ23556.1 hypothetical protein A3770_10p60740 [Chloropicon primus]
MSFVGGKLKLKGVGDVGVVRKKKKKKKKKGKGSKNEEAVVGSGQQDGGERETTLGYAIRDEGPADRRTTAEKKFEQKLAKREEEEIAKAAKMTHRERVKEFNEKLANLSEHYDIPKVGPG